LFTLYTNDCIGTDTTPLVKYSDDTALEDLSNSDHVYFEQVERFSSWCKENFLDLNVGKTKEMVIDFRKRLTAIPDLFINVMKVERMTVYKYLGTTLDEKLSFTANTDLINKKCQSRIYCLQKLRNIHISPKILENFYHCFIESILTFCFTCWYGNLSVRNKNVLNRSVNVCSKIVNVTQKSLNELYEHRVRMKSGKIVIDHSHPLSKYYELLPSGKRYRFPKCRTLRTRNSFIHKSIELMNK